MLEKNFSNYIKHSLPKDCFIHKIENGLNSSGFPDLYLLYKTIPLLIELKTSIKRNKTLKDNILFKLEKSQIAWHLNYNKFNGVSFILQNCPLKRELLLFDGYEIAYNQATKLKETKPLFHGALLDCLDVARTIALEKMQRV